MNDDSTGLWIYGGTVLAVIVANLLKKGPGVTEAAPMPSTTPPSSFSNLTEVASRFDEVKTLYRSGRLGFQETRDQVAALVEEAFRLENEGKASVDAAVSLAQQMSDFYDRTFQAEQDIARSNATV